MDEEMVQHVFRSRTRYEPGDDRDWCEDCEYHREHKIHKPTASSDRAVKEPDQEQTGDKAEECGPIHHWLDPKQIKCRCGKLTAVPFFAQTKVAAEGLISSPASQLDLEPIRKRLTDAPCGPWRLELKDALYGYYTLQTRDNRRIAEIWGGEERAEFIAAAPSDIAVLIAEIERLRAEVSYPASQKEPSVSMMSGDEAFVRELKDWLETPQRDGGGDVVAAEGLVRHIIPVLSAYGGAKLRAYRQARVFEPSMDGYAGAMATYSAAFGKPEGEIGVLTSDGEKQPWELAEVSSPARPQLDRALIEKIAAPAAREISRINDNRPSVVEREARGIVMGALRQIERALTEGAASSPTPATQSPAVQKVMERFRRRCAEVDGKHIDAEGGDPMLTVRNIVCHLNMLLTDEQKAAINWHPQQSVSLAVMRVISDLNKPASCIACPVEVRGLYAVAFNLLNLRSDPDRWNRKIGERLAELEAAVKQLTPIVDKHFADKHHQ